MTRFARKGGVIEKREAKKKKEEATEWSSMIESPTGDKLDNNDTDNHQKDNKNQEDVKTNNKNKRKHDEDTVEEKSSEQDREMASSSGGEKRKKSGLPINREILLRIHGEHIDNEVLADLDDMLERKKLTLEEYADAIVREGRSNRRRLDRKNERDSSRICFNCREPGHCVEQCPAVLKSNEVGTGICYKCGSTEHSVNRCKVRVEPGKYPYATCFICKEQGHLSKQCPDNPRGLYPNGGSCRSCGSVEHYYRDCPEVQKKNQLAEAKTLKKIKPRDNIEDLSDDDLKFSQKPEPIRKSKVVVFK